MDSIETFQRALDDIRRALDENEKKRVELVERKLGLLKTCTEKFNLCSNCIDHGKIKEAAYGCWNCQACIENLRDAP